MTTIRTILFIGIILFAVNAKALRRRGFAIRAKKSPDCKSAPARG
jgi:hypothetical protein